ncbi:threonine synthase [Candidatus Sumerlaeota bacterium]|nr:threonine synthase [Candidatus Sumerlaeota bacterium]
MTRGGLSNVTGLRCVHCGEATDLANPVYTCGSCGGNLQVEYDWESIRRGWSRESLSKNPDPTIWRYAPLYPVESTIEAPLIGGTPLFPVPRLAESLGLRSLLIKDDSCNPSASFKDRATAIALCRARDTGRDLVVGASTGNAGSSTAVLGAAMGIQTRIFVPRAAPAAKVAQLLAFGADVLAVDGTYDDAFDLCLAATDQFGWYNRNTGFNPFTREGKKSVSFEICEQLGWSVPDLVVVPVGDGNIISGVWKGFEDLHRIGFIDRLPRLLAVQAEGSAAIVNALDGDGVIHAVSGETVADSISVCLPRDGEAAVQAVKASGGLGVKVPDDEILAAILDVARGAGVFGEPAGVASFAGLKRAVAQGRIDPDGTTVMLLTGSGLKDIASVMRVAGEPRLIPPDPERLGEIFRT